jgi:hypothetical protein
MHLLTLLPPDVCGAFQRPLELQNPLCIHRKEEAEVLVLVGLRLRKLKPIPLGKHAMAFGREENFI